MMFQYKSDPLNVKDATKRIMKNKGSLAVTALILEQILIVLRIFYNNSYTDGYNLLEAQ